MNSSVSFFFGQKYCTLKKQSTLITKVLLRLKLNLFFTQNSGRYFLTAVEFTENLFAFISYALHNMQSTNKTKQCLFIIVHLAKKQRNLIIFKKLKCGYHKKCSLFWQVASKGYDIVNDAITLEKDFHRKAILSQLLRQCVIYMKLQRQSTKET